MMSETESSSGAFRRKLQRRADRLTLADLARRMGYRQVNPRVLARLNAVLGDDALGLRNGRVDLRYTSRGFYDALCDALSIDPAERDAERKRLEKIARRRRAVFKPYLFVATDFKHDKPPAFVLAFVENHRRLKFEPAFRNLSLDAQTERAGRRAQEHYRDNGGELWLWGEIRRYLFRYDDRAVLVLDTDGNVTGRTDRLDDGAEAARQPSAAADSPRETPKSE